MPACKNNAGPPRSRDARAECMPVSLTKLMCGRTAGCSEGARGAAAAALKTMLATGAVNT